MLLLLIEDDKLLCEALTYQLQREGLPTHSCNDGLEGLHRLTTTNYDLVILDRMLPNLDGLTLLRKARAAGIQTPVILLTALGELQDKIDGLNYGADDYMVKPFDFQELLARIHSRIRRPPVFVEKGRLTFADLIYDAPQHLLTCSKQSCTLSRREGNLLELFLENPNQVLPRGTLLNRVWGIHSEVEDGNLDNYIHFIRRRLKTVGAHAKITTIRGVGYRLEEIHV